MEKKAASGIMLALLLTSMLTLAFNIQSAKASGTIYIRADGSIDPPTAPIQRDGNIYSFSADIFDSVIVEKDDTVVNGNGYALQGTGTGNGFQLFGRTNVTIRNVRVVQFYAGISLVASPNNMITENTVSLNTHGIHLLQSTGCTVNNNIVTSNQGGIIVYQGSDYTTVENNTVGSSTIGIDLGMANWCTIARNNLTNNMVGMWLGRSSNDTFLGNAIRTSVVAMRLDDSHENIFCHNNFIDNTNQIFFIEENFNNVWDNGYPSGGNYWSDYTGVDDKAGPNQDQPGIDAIGDTPYIIDAENQDRYPIVNRWVERKPGVKAGDWAKYGDYVVAWNSNDLGQHPPTDIQEWMNVTVQNTAGTNITFQLVMHYQTSAEYTTIGWQDVSTSDGRGQMGLPLFISADLSAGDTLYQTVFPLPINETIFREYVGAIREVNHVAFERAFNYIAPDKYFNVSLSAYWDRAAGILTEYMVENVFVDETLNYVTSTSISFRIVETNLWEVSTPPTIAASLDIDPGTLNLQSGGKWIATYIQLPERYNPEDIDASTIMLNGTIAPVLDSKYGFVTNSSEYLVDHDNDGILERIVKFDRAALQSWIYQSVGMQHEVSMTITGELTDGTQFEGTATILAFWQGRGSPSRR